MAADGNFTNVASGSKVPPFEELNFKKFKKFFTSFLMRHNRAHLVLSKDKPRHIHDLDSTVPAGAHMTDAQKKRLRKAKKLWNTRNETAYSFLMEVCNAHPKAGTTAALSSQSGAEFVDSVEAQAKILENLGREVTEDDKLTRLKEGLTDKRYSQLAHSLCVRYVTSQAIRLKTAST
mmetsp:Transcript_18781/g.27136  ORF Transcript_18781/g.27136 Transcript_18781/m.27136 type:complete len:177 (-) Transcript_18781:667-1197(-)